MPWLLIIFATYGNNLILLIQLLLKFSLKQGISSSRPWKPSPSSPRAPHQARPAARVVAHRCKTSSRLRCIRGCRSRRPWIHSGPCTSRVGGKTYKCQRARTDPSDWRAMLRWQKHKRRVKRFAAKTCGEPRHSELRTQSPSRNRTVRIVTQPDADLRKSYSRIYLLPARRTPAATTEGGRAHVPVRSTSFIGDLSKDSMVAASLDSAFSSERCGLAADVGRFLASVFPVSWNLALPVSIFNLPRVQQKNQAGTFGLPAWPEWYKAASALSSTTCLLKNCCFSLLSELYSVHFGRCVLPFGQLPCHCLRLNTGSRLCKQQPKQVRPRPTRGKTASPSSLPQSSDW